MLEMTRKHMACLSLTLNNCFISSLFLTLNASKIAIRCDWQLRLYTLKLFSCKSHAAFRVLDCTSWKRSGARSNSSCRICNTSPSTHGGNKRPQSQQLDYAKNPAVTSLHHFQICPQRSLPGYQAFGLSGSTTSLSQHNPRDTQTASPALTKKAAKFSLSPKVSRKNRQAPPLSVHQQKLTGSLSSGFERRRVPSLGNQPLPRPISPTIPDFGTPGMW